MHISEKAPFEPAKKQTSFFSRAALSSHVFFCVSQRVSVAGKVSGAPVSEGLKHPPSWGQGLFAGTGVTRGFPRAGLPWRLCLGKHTKRHLRGEKRSHLFVHQGKCVLEK